MPDLNETYYKVENHHAQKTCEACGALMAMVPGKKTGALVPVNLATGRSHFRDCPSATSFSLRAKPQHLAGYQTEMFPGKPDPAA